MTYDELEKFLRHTMSMTGVYQPVVVRTLLEEDGAVSVRRLAEALLSYDEERLRHYISVVRRHPKATLSKHGVIVSDADEFRLTLDVDALSPEQRAHLIELCNNKISEHLARKEALAQAEKDKEPSKGQTQD